MKLFTTASSILLISSIFLHVEAQSETSTFTDCSFHQYESCDINANCTAYPNGTFECICRSGNGDGIKNGTGCGSPSCTLPTADIDCHPIANCTIFGDVSFCQCRQGYAGNGGPQEDGCVDIDECATSDRCSEHANCTNTPGSFNCTCQNNYQGNGFTCKFVCGQDSDCPMSYQQCANFECVCKEGYRDIGDDLCEDMNECDSNPCHAKANCVNTIGSYECNCKSGYFGNGFQCSQSPKTCDEIKQQNPNAKSKEDYTIDPDGTGPLGNMKVECIMKPGYGITVIDSTTLTYKFRNNRQYKTFDYEYSVAHIKKVVEESYYCYQEMSADCRWRARLLNGDDYWVDGNGVKQYTWGGATTTGYCLCGELGYCTDHLEACNCDGSSTSKRRDAGKISNKNFTLPIKEIKIRPGSGYVFVRVGAVKCAPRLFDLPLDCHEAKIGYNIHVDGPQFLNPFGDGGLEPILAHCDMTTWEHVGVTVIPHSSQTAQPPAGPGVISYFSYAVSVVEIQKIISLSYFCMQYVRYTCKNSRLMNNGSMIGYFTDINGNIITYGPGGMGQDYQCACGLTGTCDSDNVGCNCDIEDDIERDDFGYYIDKTVLPIWTFKTSDVGAGRNSSYYVGPLMCSKKEFGIPGTCEEWLERGSTESGTYFIDPDGPSSESTANLWLFPVFCEMYTNPDYAVTVVNTETNGVIQNITYGSNMWYYYYYRYVSLTQLITLTTRVVYCTQAVSYKCTRAPLHGYSGSSHLVTWKTKEGQTVAYFAGSGTDSVCQCGLTYTCASNLTCNCDVNDGIQREDDWLLENKDDLPLSAIHYSQVHGHAFVSVGPMKCFDVFPTCFDKKTFNLDENKKLEGQLVMLDGYHTIDPDGPSGVPPFTVRCIDYTTHIFITPEPTDTTTGDPSTPETTCYDVNYQMNGHNITSEQVQALVDNSLYCFQEMKVQCLNAQVTQHVNYSTCDGVTQTGWAGSKGRDMCECGVVGACAGGPGAKCNCDTVDGEQRVDGGFIYDREFLPVCGFCITLDPAENVTTDPKIRSMTTYVSDLVCNQKRLGASSSCQSLRNAGMLAPTTAQIDPDGSGYLPSIPMSCQHSLGTYVAYAEIIPKEPEIEVPSDGIDVIIQYYLYDFALIRALIRNHRYCQQTLILECHNSSLHLDYTAGYGWFDSEGFVQLPWAGAQYDQIGCANDTCNCNLGGIQFDGGLISRKNGAPVTRIKLPAAPGYRKLHIGPVKCYKLYPTCHDIKLHGATQTPHSNHLYAIDPDQEGPNDPFLVKCKFGRIGITIVETNTNYQGVINQTVPLPRPIIYERATYLQIRALVLINKIYCFQRIWVHCFNSPLINNINPAYGYYNTYGGEMSTNFGVAGHPDYVGCPCVRTNTCPGGYTCRCDRPGANTYENAYITDESIMPIQDFVIGGQFADKARLSYRITDLECGPKPFGHPKHCDQARDWGYQTGEVLIQPYTSTKPFLVYCEMNHFVKNRGVTVVQTTLKYGVNVTWNKFVSVEYFGANYFQVKKLVAVSNYCYLSFKYTCRRTKFLSGGSFYWIGSKTNTKQRYAGGGRPWMEECSCGTSNPSRCGGGENRTHLLSLNRQCNCDAGDWDLRADAGTFGYNDTDKNNLPIKTFWFKDPELSGSYGQVKLSSLYCSQEAFDIDECKTGFHDCHPKAKCINTKGSYECKCKPRWRGHGRFDVWANGRDCYDDDECALGYCPSSATCTNFEGGYNCTCKDGYIQTGPRKCIDINECTELEGPCHADAKCINLAGHYACRCKRGFRGDGHIDCQPIAECTCFGDPHCKGYDDNFLHYQGTCQYMMTTDNCASNPLPPTFEVLVVFHSRNHNATLHGRASWVKELTVNVHGFSIFMGQAYEMRVNDVKKNLPFRTATVTVEKKGRYLILHTPLGIEVRWNGKEVAQVFTPGQWKERVCGLCGNYNGNKTDDWMTGPVCPNVSSSLGQDDYEFGNSWAVSEYVELHPEECEINCTTGTGPNETDPCQGFNRSLAVQACKKVFDPNGSFKPCFDLMEEDVIDFHNISCIYDVCRADGDYSIVVCAAAETLFGECRDDYNKTIANFRTDDFCSMDCSNEKENSVYHYCGPLVEPTCLDYLTGNSPTPDNMCTEGCFCPEGMLTDGNRCVTEDECGCVYDGEYHSINEIITLSNCSESGICMPDHSVNLNSITCHENATCELRDGVFGCHCPYGYFGDGVTSCLPDPCEPSPCNPEETCQHAFDTERNYICICADGYTGDCNECEEIDECLTGTHDCPPLSHCINTPGSYECQCKEGFFQFGGKCTDIDECDLDDLQPDCGNNSKCSNTFGSYDCPCCQGYEKQNDTCVASTAEPLPDQPYCCACTSPICDRPGKVCGEDHKTYKDIKHMVISNCEKGKDPREWINVDYYSACKGSCSDVQCPQGQVCEDFPGTDKPATCNCVPCNETEKLQIEPVCTSKLIVYPNICEFKYLQCIYDMEDEVVLPTFTPCEGKGKNSPVGEWGPPGPCSQTCGIGTQTRTRLPKRNLTSEELEKFPLHKTTECYGDPCPDGPCFDFLCPTVAHVCDEFNETAAECRCPKFDPLYHDKVCGYVTWTHGGTIPVTWRNPGQLKHYACKHGAVDYTVMNTGDCGETPLNCTRLLHYDYYRTTINGVNATSTEKINWYSCDGGCSNIREECCHPYASVSEELTLDVNGQNVTRMIDLTEECKCQDIEIVHGGG